MATLQIEFKNKKFVSHNGVNVKVATDTHIEGNGWEGEVDENGNFYFIAAQYYKGKRHQLKFKISNGYVKKLLKIGDGRPRVLKSYRIPNWPIDGIIGLATGYIDERVTYFRTADFKKFLDEYGITAVRCETANGIYNLLKKHDGLHSMFFSESIESDGTVKVISEDIKVNEESSAKPFDINVMMEVTDASWVIRTVWKYGELKHRILYTLDDPQEIVGLPKLE